MAVAGSPGIIAIIRKTITEIPKSTGIAEIRRLNIYPVIKHAFDEVAAKVRLLRFITV